MEIQYKQENEIPPAEVSALYMAAGLRRPITDSHILEGMLRNASVIVTARIGADLIGLARTLTDFTYVAYLADLAVHPSYQKMGVGRHLVLHTKAFLEESCFITLFSAPEANSYYPYIGFTHNPRAWMLGKKPLPPTPGEQDSGGNGG